MQESFGSSEAQLVFDSTRKSAACGRTGDTDEKPKLCTARELPASGASMVDMDKVVFFICVLSILLIVADAVAFNNSGLETATKLWLSDVSKSLERYGHISEWNISQVTVLHQSKSYKQ